MWVSNSTARGQEARTPSPVGRRSLVSLSPSFSPAATPRSAPPDGARYGEPYRVLRTIKPRPPSAPPPTGVAPELGMAYVAATSLRGVLVASDPSGDGSRCDQQSDASGGKRRADSRRYPATELNAGEETIRLRLRLSLRRNIGPRRARGFSFSEENAKAERKGRKEYERYHKKNKPKKGNRRNDTSEARFLVARYRLLSPTADTRGPPTGGPPTRGPTCHLHGDGVGTVRHGGAVPTFRSVSRYGGGWGPHHSGAMTAATEPHSLWLGGLLLVMGLWQDADDT
ncbi:hypothetical protein DAI22_11g043000 [Oryza sativa Japonica Group]|nr:hypothetical protein DAI22_11g043000 [Oryza sativa Japonica Group]